MAVKLRLRREGTKKKPHFRVVAADARAARDGRFLEIVGDYHPQEEPSRVEINHERALHWLRNGAQPTDAVKNLLRISGVWQEFQPGDEPTRTSPAGETTAGQASEEATEGGHASGDEPHTSGE